MPFAFAAAAAARPGAAGACDAGAFPPPRRNPHEPQNRLLGALTCAHCGQVTVPDPLAATDAGGAATGCGAGAVGMGCAAGPLAFATDTGAAATGAAFTPCVGVCGENGFGCASRGSSAPHPKQNL